MNSRIHEKKSTPPKVSGIPSAVRDLKYIYERKKKFEQRLIYTIFWLLFAKIVDLFCLLFTIHIAEIELGEIYYYWVFPYAVIQKLRGFQQFARMVVFRVVSLFHGEWRSESSGDGSAKRG